MQAKICKLHQHTTIYDGIMKRVEPWIGREIDLGECRKMTRLTWEAGQHRTTGFEL